MYLIELKDDGITLLDIQGDGRHPSIKQTVTIAFKTNFKDVLSDAHQFRLLSSTIKQFSRSKTAVLTLSQSNLIYRDLAAPKTNPKYLASLARHELTHALNLSSDYIIDYALLPPTQADNKHKILIAGMQTPVLHEIIECFKRCDVRIIRMDASLNNLMHYLNAYHADYRDKTLLTLEVSPQGLRQYYFEKGQFMYQRTNRMNLNALDSDALMKTLLDQVDKMHHFILAQTKGASLDEILIFGSHPQQTDLAMAITTQLQIPAACMRIPRVFKDKQTLYDNAHTYLYGAMAKPSKLKAIDFAMGYKTKYQKRDWLALSHRWFNPVLVLTIYFVVTALIILSIQIKQVSDSIHSLNTFLKQDAVVTKMAEINAMQAETTILNDIHAEITLIENILVKYPKLSKELLDALFLNRPANINFSAIRYQDLTLEVDLNTHDVQLIHQYVSILKAQNQFKSVSYMQYEQDAQSGRFSTSLTLQLKEAE